MNKEKEIIENLIAFADVKIGGNRPWDINVHDDAFYKQLLSHGSLGLGEAYMQGLWDCPALDQLFYRILQAELNTKLKPTLKVISIFLKNRIFKPTKKDSFKLKHYDTGNALYRHMLDKRMVYTCAYWPNANNLDEAQEAKLELVCKKINLKPGMKILDIGCGWGSFMKYAAEKYRVNCVGVTISPAQVELGQQLCSGLPIEFRLQDYRDITGKYDAIVSLGMFEHVGATNYKKYMKVAAEHLSDDGLFLLHTIGSNVTAPLRAADPWISKYIFTNGMLPSIKQIGRAIENIFIMEDWHNFGASYDKTLMAWHQNFEKSWPEVKQESGGIYDEVFFRMWRYYLLSCAGAFRARSIQLWQIVLSKKGVKGGYQSAR